MEDRKLSIADSHIHLSHRLFEQFFPFLNYGEEGIILEDHGTREHVIWLMKEASIEFCVEPAIDIESNYLVLNLSKKYNGFVFPAVGVHPTRTYQYIATGRHGKRIKKLLPWKARNFISECSANEMVVAIGETGLDYHLPRNEQHRFRQIAWFVWHLLLANKRKLPVILHIRRADRHALLILSLFKRLLHGGVYHCFRGTPKDAKKIRKLGLKLGIGASLLYEGKTGADLLQVILETPLEDILLETDGPYVKPPCQSIPAKRMKNARNTSLILPAVIQRIAEIKGVSSEEVAHITTANAKYLFGISQKNESFSA